MEFNEIMQAIKDAVQHYEDGMLDSWETYIKIQDLLDKLDPIELEAQHNARGN